MQKPWWSNLPASVAALYKGPEFVCLTGKVSNLAFDNTTGVASWAIRVLKLTVYNVEASDATTLEQFDKMDEGSLVGVVLEVPPEHLADPSAPLRAVYLVLLDNTPLYPAYLDLLN